jgi:hypothetical protein
MGLLDALSDDQGVKNSRLSYGLATKELGKGLDKSNNALKKNYQQADPFLAQAQELFSLIQPQQQAGYDMYQNALGLRGPEGNEAAVGAFQQGPGFQFALDQANQNVMRNQAATGGLNSGGTLMALSDRAQGLQNQEYGSWLDRLHGFDPMQGAIAQSNVLGQRADMRYGLGRDLANVQAQFRPQMAQQGYNLGANINNAQQTANSNMWGALTGGLTGLGSILGA